MVNRLAHETSPYLLQHAMNPVDWYPWGPEALQRALAEDKPIFLSIGYSACHWCHVMAHESFDDPVIAEILNRLFVSVKVDREERPELDHIYMEAVQALTGGGGWPLSVFLTPQGKPFYGGTYFPPQPRFGLPSFSEVLLAVADAWQVRRLELEAGAARLTAALETAVRVEHTASGIDGSTPARAVERLSASFDAASGGWNGAPKFPQAMVLEFLLRHHHATADQSALRMVTQTLAAMARGGMYDQLGGGFHRYSVDGRWMVPHFEKMLYDNAQLALVYLHGWQATGDTFFRVIAEETLDYVLRDMTDLDGGFYSSQDADSEGEEGKYYLWTTEQIRSALGDRAESFTQAHLASMQGDLEDRNILNFRGELHQRLALGDARAVLLERRRARVPPGRDAKIITSWNALMLRTFAEAARVLDRQDYRQAAEANAAFLLHELRQDSGRLWRTWTAGPQRSRQEGSRVGSHGRLNGYLEDYASLIDGLLELYQTTFEATLFVAAQELAETMMAHFLAPDGTRLFDTSDDHESLVTRPSNLQDNAFPSGNSLAITALLKLGILACEPHYVELAHRLLSRQQSLMAEYPLGFGQGLQALSFALSQPAEIAVVGDPKAKDTRELLAVVREGYRPFQAVALAAPGADQQVPLLRGRGLLDGRATVYVCREFVCQAPAANPEELKRLLRWEPDSRRSRLDRVDEL